jgi:hypothetical protein
MAADESSPNKSKGCLKFLLIGFGMAILAVGGMAVLGICPPPGPWPTPPWCGDGSGIRNADLPCPPPGPWGAPPWCDQVKEEDFTFLDEAKKAELLDNPTFWTVPSHNIFEFQQELQTLHPNAVAWAGINKYESDLESVATKQMLYTYQLESTLLVSSYLGLGNPNGVAPELHDEGLAVRDLHGEPVSFSKFDVYPDSSEEEAAMLWYNPLDQEYQQIMLDYGRYNIDMSSNGIVIDNLPMRSVIYKGGGSFDEQTMVRFREHLSSKFTPDELSEKFSIDSIENFVFSDYIKQNGLEDSWNSSPVSTEVHPLTYEFNLFLAEQTNQYLATYKDTVEKYAADKDGRSSLFSINSSPLYDWMTWNQVDYLDYLSGEHFWFGQAFQKAATAVTLAQDLTPSSKLVILAEVDHYHTQIPDETVNLFKYMFADTYAVRGGSLMSDSARFFTMLDFSYLSWDDWVKYDQAEAGRYIRFMQDHRDLYLKEKQADIGLVHSIASRHGDNMPMEENFSEGNNITQAIEMLFNLNIPFEMIVSGNDIAFHQEFTLEQLTPYRLVILPSVFMISDNEVQALMDYVNNGGVVLQLRQFATHNKAGQEVSRPELQGISDQSGSQTIGVGTWRTLLDFQLSGYTWNNDQGKALLPNQQSLENPHLQELGSVIREYIAPEIVTDAPITVNVHKYSDGQRVILHVVNYDYDIASDQFTTPAPFEVSVDTSGLIVNTVRLYDFEKGSVSDLEFNQDANMVKFEIGDLYAYSIIELIH